MSLYEKLTKAELIERLQDLQAKQIVRDGLEQAAAELEVHQAELEIQNRELIETQKLLEQSRERYANLFDFAPIGYLVLDKFGVILDINLTAAESLCNERKGFLGLPFNHYVHKESVGQFWEHLRRCRSQVGRNAVAELTLKARNGSLHNVQIVSVACSESDDQAAFRSALIDLADRKRAEADRERFILEKASRREAENANRSKDEFLAMLSHELRTPLHTIQGWLYMLRFGHLTHEETQHGLDVIERSVTAQARLVNDLLDLSRLTREKVTIEQKAVDLVSVIESTIEILRFGIEEKRLSIHKSLGALGGYVVGDALRLQQVTTNLIQNAVKFTPEGGKIEVRLRRAQASDGTPTAELEVEDTGIGISPAILPLIFENFRQGDSSTTRSHGGLGLGLAIAKSLVELHKGTICVESAGEGKGTTFVVTLPLVLDNGRMESRTRTPKKEDASPVSAAAPEPSVDSLQGVRVLIVDDDSFSRDLVKRLLEPHGVVVKTAESADAGLELVHKFHPQVLLSDIAMPEKDGYYLIERIRTLAPEDGRNVRAIALTAFASPVDRAKALASGFEAFLSKPVDPAVLVSGIAKLAGLPSH